MQSGTAPVIIDVQLGLFEENDPVQLLNKIYFVTTPRQRVFESEGRSNRMNRIYRIITKLKSSQLDHLNHPVHLVHPVNSSPKRLWLNRYAF